MNLDVQTWRSITQFLLIKDTVRLHWSNSRIYEELSWEIFMETFDRAQHSMDRYDVDEVYSMENPLYDPEAW